MLFRSMVVKRDALIKQRKLLAARERGERGKQRQATREKLAAVQSEIDRLKHETNRAYYISEFNRLVDGDAKFYAPLLKNIEFPRFLLRRVGEAGPHLTQEQRNMPAAREVAKRLLDEWSKRRSNALTGGRDMASMEHHIQELTGRENGKIRTLVIKNKQLADSTDGMAYYQG